MPMRFGRFQWYLVAILAGEARSVGDEQRRGLPGAGLGGGPGHNSMYTKHLLHFLKMPGLTVEQLFREVRMAVVSETGGRQLPWESSSIPSEFSLTGR